MNKKILSVDDSKAVRIIIKKSFKKHAVDVIEAANGVEGLAAAAKDKPELILLDVTMPVMDGVEMLTKLKADPALKGIPVIMLTAEAGRENVMKIAKIGIRDYIIKPFKEEVLVEKVGRIIEVKPLDAVPAAEGGAAPAVDLTAGVFVDDDDALLVQFPADVSADVLKAIHGVMSAKVSEAVDNGFYRVIFDLSKLTAINEEIVNIIDGGIQNCQELTLSHILVGSSELAEQSKAIEASKEWSFSASLEEAKVG